MKRTLTVFGVMLGAVFVWDRFFKPALARVGPSLPPAGGGGGGGGGGTDWRRFVDEWWGYIAPEDRTIADDIYEDLVFEDPELMGSFY